MVERRQRRKQWEAHEEIVLATGAGDSMSELITKAKLVRTGDREATVVFEVDAARLAKIASLVVQWIGVPGGTDVVKWKISPPSGSSSGDAPGTGL
jgi:hypothetical protein